MMMTFVMMVIFVMMVAVVVFAQRVPLQSGQYLVSKKGPEAYG